MYCRVHLRPLTPDGYTRSLLLFLVPVVNIAFGFLPREEVEINWLKNILNLSPMPIRKSMSIEQHLIEMRSNQAVWRQRPLLRKVYGHLYQLIRRALAPLPGPIVEIGSGIGARKLYSWLHGLWMSSFARFLSCSPAARLGPQDCVGGSRYMWSHFPV